MSIHVIGVLYSEGLSLGFSASLRHLSDCCCCTVESGLSSSSCTSDGTITMVVVYYYWCVPLRSFFSSRKSLCFLPEKKEGYNIALFVPV